MSFFYFIVFSFTEMLDIDLHMVPDGAADLPLGSQKEERIFDFYSREVFHIVIIVIVVKELNTGQRMRM